jgi:hypothetical protein
MVPGHHHSNAVDLTVGGAGILRYQSGSALDGRQSPRPFLHPVQTLSGTLVTDSEPPDHSHHLGISVAFSDVSGTNYWGGRTFKPGEGSVMLANHGRQQVTDVYSGKDSISEYLDWIGADGGVQAVERRRIQVMRHADPRAWAMSITSTIRPADELDHLEISSSAVKGRAGAGYGGIFWRFPRDARAELVLTEAGTGTDLAHGSLSPWLSLAAVVAGRRASVVLAQEPGRTLPWFLRTEGYLGAGPAVAWENSRTVSRDNPLNLTLHAVVMDGVVDSPTLARRLLDHHPTLRRQSTQPALTHR